MNSKDLIAGILLNINKMKVDGIPKSGNLFIMNGGVPVQLLLGRKFFDGLNWWKILNGQKKPYTPPTKLLLGLQPTYCPVCGHIMKDRLDAKFWILLKCCYNCAIEKQQQMVMDGTWLNYILSKNIKSLISKTRLKLSVLSKMKLNINKLNKLNFTKNSTGLVLNWDIPKSVNLKINKNIDYYVNLYTLFLKYLENRLSLVLSNIKK